MTESKMVACTLSGPDLIERLLEWQGVTSRAIGREINGRRILSTYPADPLLLERLRGLIAAEAECCSFMQFTIRQRADAIEVELQLPEDLPKDAGSALAVMLGLVTQPSEI